MIFPSWRCIPSLSEDEDEDEDGDNEDDEDEEIELFELLFIILACFDGDFNFDDGDGLLALFALLGDGDFDDVGDNFDDNFLVRFFDFLQS